MRIILHSSSITNFIKTSEDRNVLMTERNHMPDEYGITLNVQNEEVKELKFHSYFSDGMVLQRDIPNNVWGYSINKAISAKIICL